jgi:hypothetical protein
MQHTVFAMLKIYKNLINYIYIYIYIVTKSTGLLKIIVAVLTTCHTQYT